MLGIAPCGESSQFARRPDLLLLSWNTGIMDNKDLPKAIALIFGAFCLIGFVAWIVIRNDRIEQNLLNELNEVAQLDNQSCPFDGSRTRTSSVMLFDFSDPLPVELSSYPDSLLESTMNGLQEAQRFDRFSLYTLNPYDRVPRNIGTFCVPVTMGQIPREIRQALWGTDPEQYSTLPSRYERFEEVFENLWENDKELKETVEEVRTALVSESQREEQTYSRIIENIEEIAGLEIDRGSRRIRFLILSDMLQNSPVYSHYRQGLNFNNYRPERREGWLDMGRFSFEIYLVQSCFSLGTERRRALIQFWDDYFDGSDASVDFRLLSIDGRDCSTQESIEAEGSERLGEADTGSPDSPTVNGNAASLEARTVDASTERNILDTPASGQLSPEAGENPDSGDLTVDLVDCAAPSIRRLPPLGYPRNARGPAMLRYKITVNERGIPLEYEPLGLEIDVRRYERLFKEHAEEYIARLRFDTHIDDECVGGQDAQLSLRYDDY